MTQPNFCHDKTDQAHCRRHLREEEEEGLLTVYNE